MSSDEAESSEEEDNIPDEDLEDMGKSIEHMLSNKKSSKQIILEREEKELKNLHKMMMSNDVKSTTPNKRKKDEEGEGDGGDPVPKIMKITRTFQNQAGKEYTRVEYVRNPQSHRSLRQNQTNQGESCPFFIKNPRD